MSLKTKHKSKESAIESAFLKSKTLFGELALETIAPQTGLQQDLSLGIKIKLEADTHPPFRFSDRRKAVAPTVFILCEVLYFGRFVFGKMHALLFRKWKNNVKGRHWYDLEWYVRKGIGLNLTHFRIRTQDSGDWEKALNKSRYRIPPRVAKEQRTAKGTSSCP